MTAFSPDPSDLGPESRRVGRGRRGAGARNGRATSADAPTKALAARARYSRWDGTQRIAELDADEILDALADDVMEEGDLAEALRRLMERGWRTGDPTRGDMVGLHDLLERLEQRRQELLDRYQLGDALGDVRRELEAIVEEERAGVQRRLDEASRSGERADGDARRSNTTASHQREAEGADGRGHARADGADAANDPDGAGDATLAGAGNGASPADQADLRAMLRAVAARRLDQLDALPADVGDRIRGLQEYDFLEPGARERFDDLVKRLRQQVLDQYVAGMSEAIGSMTPEVVAANREMVRDLNQLIRERLAGGDPDASEFLAKHGQFFPGARTFDDIIDQVAQRMAAMQSLMRSMSPDQRAELQSMMDALLRDDRFLFDLAQLALNLDQLLPGGLGERVPFGGEEPLGLDGALAQIARLQAMDKLGDSLSNAGTPEDLDAIDRDEVRDLIGEDAVRELDALDDLARRLEEAGYLTRDGEQLQLTPRGNRRIGQKVLDDLFARLQRDAFGGHRLERAGRGGERDETTKPYEFGDAFHLDLRGTLFNALGRDENAPGARGANAPIRLRPEDFAVHRTELLTRTSTVLLVDMSRSMLLRGCFLAAKKVAVALDTLIRTQFPRDHLSVIGFAYYAREIPPGTLAELTWHGYEYGTNLQHGLVLARRTLSRQHATNKEIVVITDGEPTAHFEDGQVEFNYPPTRRTINETLREVQRCTKEGITINTFMLERSPSLAEFVGHMTRLNRGRAFYASPERLGDYVLVDFVNRRTKHVS